jgi:glyoxylase-like metal-dependent hydrolase (beta-lactamase superfamily II)
MPVAHEVDRVAPGIVLWQFYDPAVKADLFSTALNTPTGTCLIDPIPLAPGARETLSGQGVSGIFVTNVNHARAADQFARMFAVPIFVHSDLVGIADFPNATAMPEGKTNGLTGIGIEGGPLGEMALHYDEAAGTIIVGDALINFEPQGLGFLPAKYCRDVRQMRRSLEKLLDYKFDRMFFAHGTPILSGARDRLEQLLR